MTPEGCGRCAKIHDTGSCAKSGRIAFGVPIIKERPGITDEETVEQSLQNPYLQFFPGLQEFRQKALLVSSMMVYFRNRFDQEDFDLINAKIITLAAADLAQPPGESLNPTAASDEMSEEGKYR